MNDIDRKYRKYKKYLTNSVWIVPEKTLLAYEYIEGKTIPVKDQTVWIIDSYDKGYFFGKSYTSLNGINLNQSNFVGSITPEGSVYITFYIDGDTTNKFINGIGTFKKEKCKDRKYVFTMQMNSATNGTTGLSHWSYMINVNKDDILYHHLPSLNISVPAFISSFLIK
jgi:hypothetical protein